MIRPRLKAKCELDSIQLNQLKEKLYKILKEYKAYQKGGLAHAVNEILDIFYYDEFYYDKQKSNNNIMKKEIELPKGATIEIKKNKIIIEYDDVFEPKIGDFCVIDEDFDHHRTLFIYNGKVIRWGFFDYHAAKIGTLISIEPETWVSGTPRPATDEERNELLEALHGLGKDWDAEKMELVDLKWKPKEGEIVYLASVVTEDKVHRISYAGVEYHKRLLKRGLLFRTRAEAIACTERMLEAAKTK